MRQLFLSTALLASCSGCFGPAPAAQFVQQAQRLHDGALASAVTADRDLREYVQLVGQRVATAARAAEPDRTRDALFSQVQFHLVACPVPNVFVTGGSHVYVYNGLFQLCQSEDELAAAIAHAYAHAVGLDVEHIGIQPDPNLPLPNVAWQFVIHRFTRAQEQSADRLGFEVYRRAGYDPRRFAMLFEHLSQMFPEVPTAPDRVSIADRARQAGEWSASGGAESNRLRRPLPVADPQTFKSLRNQAAALNPQLTNPEGQLFLRAFPNCTLSGDAPEQQAAQQQLRPPPTAATKLEPS